MQPLAKEPFETSLTGLPWALEDYGNPSYQNYAPQFGVNGGIHGVFQYTAPEAGSQQINKPPTSTSTLTTPIKQHTFQKCVLQTIQAAEQTQQVLQKQFLNANEEHFIMLSFLTTIIAIFWAAFATLAKLIWTERTQEQYAQDIKAIQTDINAL